MPILWRARLRPVSGADLLAAVATIAFAAGVALALVATDVSFAQVPLWDVALVISMLAVLASALGFPEWWAWAGGWGAKGRACDGARERRASHTVDMSKARAPHARRRPDRPGAHRIVRPSSGALAGATHRSRAEWLLAARERDSRPRLQRQHGRPRD